MGEKDNPFARELPATEYFVSREKEVRDAVHAAKTGIKGLRAYMGGRGIGKTSLLGAIERALAVDRACKVLRVDRPRALSLLPSLIQEAGFQPMGGGLERLIQVMSQSDAPRLCVLLDEIEGLLDTEEGRSLLENLRLVYEQSNTRFTVFVFGGSRLRSLLKNSASPFLRTAELIPLLGFSAEESRKFFERRTQTPLGEMALTSLWEHTNGHPLLLQRMIARAIELQPEEATSLDSSIYQALAEPLTRDTLYGLWWDNFESGGQDVYRKLVATRELVTEDNAARVLGERPFEQLEVLASTGVVRETERQWLPRGELFLRWYEKNFWRESVVPSSSGNEELFANRSSFERDVIESVAVWLRGMLEFPAFALREKTKGKGNDRLQLEDYFQVTLLQALRQRSFQVEAESLSVGRKDRSDLKVRGALSEERACGEVKRWTGTPDEYQGIVEQVLGYAVPTDSFAFTVMVDRQKRSLAAAYRKQCIERVSDAVVLWPRTNDEQYRIPAFVTEHKRDSSTPLRVYHMLLQLPPGDD